MSETSSTERENSWPRFDPSRWPLVLWRQPVLILLVFAVGGATAFAYSYAPLHRANRWEIDYLEERLALRNEQGSQLETELAEARAALAEVAPAEAFSALEARLEEATNLASAREREIASLEKKLSQGQRTLRKERSARARAEEEIAMKAAEAIAAATPSPTEPPPEAEIASTPAETAPSTPPASPAPNIEAPGTAAESATTTGSRSGEAAPDSGDGSHGRN